MQIGVAIQPHKAVQVIHFVLHDPSEGAAGLNALLYASRCPGHHDHGNRPMHQAPHSRKTEARFVAFVFLAAPTLKARVDKFQGGFGRININQPFENANLWRGNGASIAGAGAVIVQGVAHIGQNSRNIGAGKIGERRGWLPQDGIAKFNEWHNWHETSDRKQKAEMKKQKMSNRTGAKILC